jgi:hypothetical protein
MAQVVKINDEVKPGIAHEFEVQALAARPSSAGADSGGPTQMLNMSPIK